MDRELALISPGASLGHGPTRGGADLLVVRGRVHAVEARAKAKVGQFQVAGNVDQEVVRFDVPVRAERTGKHREL